MSLKIGIVGLPNVGKSSLFSALTKNKIDIANYPFTTIDPNIGMVTVADERLDKLAIMSKSKKIVPTYIEFVDIAGLVKGASQGQGLGNQFLAQIREVDTVLEVVRGFHSASVIHTEGEPDPKRDISIINTELILKDMETLQNHLQKKGLTQKERNALQKAIDSLNKEILISKIDLNREEKEILDPLCLLTSKPFLYLLNVSKDEEKIKIEGIDFTYLNIKEELEANEFDEEDLANLGFKSALNDLISAAYKTLNIITFLTTGEDETRAWTIKKGSVAPQAGAAIHTDFEDKFIKAMVIPWKKLLEAGSWPEAMSKGFIKTCGKDYPIEEGDVIEFKI